MTVHPALQPMKKLTSVGYGLILSLVGCHFCSFNLQG